MRNSRALRRGNSLFVLGRCCARGKGATHSDVRAAAFLRSVSSAPHASLISRCAELARGKLARLAAWERYGIPGPNACVSCARLRGRSASQCFVDSTAAQLDASRLGLECWNLGAGLGPEFRRFISRTPAMTPLKVAPLRVALSGDATERVRVCGDDGFVITPEHQNSQ